MSGYPGDLSKYAGKRVRVVAEFEVEPNTEVSSHPWLYAVNGTAIDVREIVSIEEIATSEPTPAWASTVGEVVRYPATGEVAARIEYGWYSEAAGRDDFTVWADVQAGRAVHLVPERRS